MFIVHDVAPSLLILPTPGLSLRVADTSGLTSATVGASVNVQGAVSLKAQIDFDADLQWSKTLLPRIKIPGTSVNLGIIQVGISFFLQLDALVSAWELQCVTLSSGRCSSLALPECCPFLAVLFFCAGSLEGVR
jgi:hypothetical protein